MDSGNYLLLSLAVELAAVDNAVVGLVIPERTGFCIPQNISSTRETDRRRKKEKRKAEKSRELTRTASAVII
jgi:hypothetical protein